MKIIIFAEKEKRRGNSKSLRKYPGQVDSTYLLFESIKQAEVV